MIIEINLKQNFVVKQICEKCVIEKMKTKSYRVSIRQAIMLLKLLHDDFMKLILKKNDFVKVANEVLYVFILLNDFT